MKRSFTARQRIRMFGIKHKAAAAVLQTDASIRHHHARSKPHIVRLNKRHHHAAGIGGGEVNSPALRRFTVDKIRGLIRIDQRRARLQVIVAEQPFRRKFQMIFIGDIAIEIRQRQFHRFNRQVQRLYRSPGDDDQYHTAQECPTQSVSQSPCPLGGNSCTEPPANSRDSSVTQSALWFARSASLRCAPCALANAAIFCASSPR